MSSDCVHFDQPGHHPRSVAVVDDDGAVRESLRFLLETAGFSVHTYMSAGQFLGEAVERLPACLIVDHHMPQVTGLELLAELRLMEIRVPVVLMSGSLSPELRSRAAELGAALVLSKPLTGDDLLHFVSSTDACSPARCQRGN